MNTQYCDIHRASQCLARIVTNRESLSLFAADNLPVYRSRFILPIIVIYPPPTSQTLSIIPQNNLELPITQVGTSTSVNLWINLWHNAAHSKKGSKYSCELPCLSNGYGQTKPVYNATLSGVSFDRSAA